MVSGKRKEPRILSEFHEIHLQKNRKLTSHPQRKIINGTRIEPHQHTVRLDQSPSINLVLNKSNFKITIIVQKIDKQIHLKFDKYIKDKSI